MNKMNAYEQNQQLINEFKAAVNSGDLKAASRLYDNASMYVDASTSLSRFGYEAVAYAKAHGFRLNDSNVNWPSNCKLA